MDFKFKVIGLNHQKDFSNSFTVGKVYEAKDGMVRGNNGYPFTSWATCDATFENLREWWKDWYEVQLVDDTFSKPEEPVQDDNLNIDEMDAVIQEYCNCDCDACVIENICASISGCFYNHYPECKAAYEIIQGLFTNDPNDPIENGELVFIKGNDIYRRKLNDPVNHPSHYTKGKIEVADFIADQKLNFDRGNAVKYVCRAGSKDPDKEIQDLEKAIWYINHEIKMLKGETENVRNTENPD